MAKPFQKTYTPAAVDTDGIVDGATGATSPLVQLSSGAGDGLAHQLNLTSGDNLAGITFTITGTDENGSAQSEAIAGPGATTIETTGYFLTVTSIAISATLGANTVDIGWVDEFVTPTIPLDHRAGQCACFVTPGGTINYTLQKTYTQMSAPPFVFSDAVDPNGVIVAADITDAVEFAFSPVPSGMRLQANSYSSGATLILNLNHTYN
jgi:hypothetical protein